MQGGFRSKGSQLPESILQTVNMRILQNPSPTWKEIRLIATIIGTVTIATARTATTMIMTRMMLIVVVVAVAVAVAVAAAAVVEVIVVLVVVGAVVVLVLVLVVLVVSAGNLKHAVDKILMYLKELAQFLF